MQLKLEDIKLQQHGITPGYIWLTLQDGQSIKIDPFQLCDLHKYGSIEFDERET